VEVKNWWFGNVFPKGVFSGLAGGFKDFLFLPLPGEMIQFD